MLRQDDLIYCWWDDLEGKTLELHVAYIKEKFCLIGIDKETDIKYMLAKS